MGYTFIRVEECDNNKLNWTSHCSWQACWTTSANHFKRAAENGAFNHRNTYSKYQTESINYITTYASLDHYMSKKSLTHFYQHCRNHSPGLLRKHLGSSLEFHQEPGSVSPHACQLRHVLNKLDIIKTTVIRLLEQVMEVIWCMKRPQLFYLDSWTNNNWQYMPVIEDMILTILHLFQWLGPTSFSNCDSCFINEYNVAEHSKNDEGKTERLQADINSWT